MKTVTRWEPQRDLPYDPKRGMLMGVNITAYENDMPIAVGRGLTETDAKLMLESRLKSMGNQIGG